MGTNKTRRTFLHDGSLLLLGGGIVAMNRDGGGLAMTVRLPLAGQAIQGRATS